MTIAVDQSQAPVYNGDILNEIHLKKLSITCEEATDGSRPLPARVEFDFTFYGKTPNGNRLYNKTSSQVFDKCVVNNFIEYATAKAAQGDLNAANALMFIEKVAADIIKEQKPQYSTVAFQES